MIQRVYHRYREGGVPALRAAAWRRLLGRAARQHPALRWTQLGNLSLGLARVRPLLCPPVVILSLPRSGSSWVGNLLGRAPDAAYLREPLTKTHLAAGNTQVVEPLPGGGPNAPYRSAARLAFMGLPDLTVADDVVGYPEAWAFAERRRRRLVLKEVNPHLAGWLIKAYQPRILYLLRHPASIALSYKQRGWWPSQNPWEDLGGQFSRAHLAAWRSLQGYPQVHFITYDALCESPETLFRELLSFAGLTWDETVSEHLRAQTSSDDGQPYGVHRVSQNMVRSWVGKIAPDDLAALKKGFLSCPVPWYQSEADWN